MNLLKTIAARSTGAMLPLMLFATQAMAAGGTLQPVQSTLQTLVETLTGPIATALAVLFCIFMGFMAWAARLSWFVAGSWILGVVLVFGSAQIVEFFQSAVGT
ncbi:TrbC/VirB2 family protein [Rhizobium sp. NXC24]|uniref:TrbC/VirB2 family protein n=1 Tax=Rhizobium sp. NXC24 TaxID=2048897 RepID=UPI000CDF41A9|nr:TrbC/VirB2 family protein [Rhizobium sp. NXC24]AVA23839.1 type IV secretion system TrbC/VirB2 family protein [Rhizobium sp. NXC24]